MGLKKRKYRLDNVSGKYLWFLWSFIFCNIAVTAVSPGNTQCGEKKIFPPGFCTLFISEAHPCGLKDHGHYKEAKPLGFS